MLAGKGFLAIASAGALVGVGVMAAAVAVESLPILAGASGLAVFSAAVGGYKLLANGGRDEVDDGTAPGGPATDVAETRPRNSSGSERRSPTNSPSERAAQG